MATLAAAVRIVPADSPRQQIALGLVHGIAGVLVVLACGLTWSGLLLVGALLLHQHLLRAERQRWQSQLMAVLYDSAGQWQLQWRDGSRDAATLAPGAIVTPWCTFLRLRSTRGAFPLVITPDMLDDTSFRRLRARLLWQRPVANARPS